MKLTKKQTEKLKSMLISDNHNNPNLVYELLKVLVRDEANALASRANSPGKDALNNQIAFIAASCKSMDQLEHGLRRCISRIKESTPLH
jgi:hypothetical protein